MSWGRRRAAGTLRAARRRCQPESVGVVPLYYQPVPPRRRSRIRGHIPSEFGCAGQGGDVPVPVDGRRAKLARAGLARFVGLVRLAAKVPALAGYAQMYSSAMAPSRHLATVTMRTPLSNSPTTHVHSPEPNLIGWDAIYGLVYPHRSPQRTPSWPQCARGYRGSWLASPVHQDIAGVVAGEDASPITVVPTHEIEFIHPPKVAIYLVVVRHLQSASRDSQGARGCDVIHVLGRWPALSAVSPRAALGSHLPTSLTHEVSE